MVIAGSVSENYVARGSLSSADGLSSAQQCQSVEEWRSCEQVENGTPSTSLLYGDSDDDNDSGPKPSDLYGKFTWKIGNFSEISKKELRSSAFEVGGYKWHILIYPQGCDACNHLSLFLCVANHDKLLPGWGHFALFTIAVVNKDLKKNKYNGRYVDTLHRFCKKEHDWGWKKFMELNKVMDDFVVDDTLTIKAQIQVIREKAHRPFRCLDFQYRRELVRVYLSAVEKSCVEFVNERRQKLQILIGDKAKLSSFHAFWLGIDPNTKRHMSRDKTDAVLKAAVKSFFIEKEVLSTLVMDSLYGGLRALKIQSKIRKPRTSLLEKEEIPAPLIFIEDDMFVLADDIFRLLERASLQFSYLPLPSKEERGLPTRAKDGCSGDEFSKDSILRDERFLTELGRRTLEIFVLAHIFSKIEIAYQESVALKRQEELIREEEEAEQVENEKRERKAKKKQTRQRRNNHKVKGKGKDEESTGALKEKHQLQDLLSDDRILEDFSLDHGQQVNENSVLSGSTSDVSDPGDDGVEALQLDVEGRDSSPLIWDTNTSKINPTDEACRGDTSNGQLEKKSPSVVDDSSSTCSTDSVPSVVVNVPYKGKASNSKNKRNSSNRGNSQQNKDMRNISTSNKDKRNSSSNTDSVPRLSGTSNANGPKSDGNFPSKDELQRLEQQLSKKEIYMKPGNKANMKDETQKEIPSRTSESSSSSASSNWKPISIMQSTRNEQVSADDLASSSSIQYDKSISLLVESSLNLSIPKSEAMTSGMHLASSMSRPSSAPVIAGPKPPVSLVSISQTTPLLSRALSSGGCLDSEPSVFARSLEPLSYRNAIMGIKTATGASTSGFASRPSLSSSQAPSSSSSSSFPHPSCSTARKYQISTNPVFSFGSGRHEYFQDNTRNGGSVGSVISLRQSQGAMPDEFPHLDIINDLLDEDQIIGSAAFNHDDFHPINQHYAFPADLVTSISQNNAYPFDTPDDYYYDKVSQMIYDSFVPLHGFGDLQPLQLDFSGYGNGMDGLAQNQWPVGGADLVNFSGVMNASGYVYPLPEYSGCNVGGYNMMYQPANGNI